MSEPWFSGALDLRAYKEGEWVLLEPFRYHARDGREFTVPRWFISDLASTPWLVKPLLNEEDRPAGVIHDWIFCAQLLPRAEANALYDEMLEVLGWSRVKRSMVAAGLAVGSYPRYRACDGGPKVDDFAWEFMTAAEREAYRISFLEAGDWVARTG